MIEPLDYEASHEYYITIEATDGGAPPLSDMATVNINLTDVNDNRPAFSQDVYTAVVSEDTELGRTVVTVRPDGGRRRPRDISASELSPFYPAARHLHSVIIYCTLLLTFIAYLHLWKVTIWRHS